MKSNLIFIEFLILIAVTACSQGSDGSFNLVEYAEATHFKIEAIESELVVNIDDYFGTVTKLSDVVEDFYFLRLDTKGEILGEVTKVLAADSILILADRYVTKSFAGFNVFTGDLHFFINDVGEAPTQYQSLYDLDIDEINQRILVFDGDKRKIHEFNYQGEYIGNKKTSGFLSGFRFFNNTIIAKTSGLINGHLGFGYKSANFLWFDSLHNLVGYSEPTNSNEYRNSYQGYDYLNRFEEDISFLPPYGYAIYTYNTLTQELGSPLAVMSSSKLWDTQEARSSSSDEFRKRSEENLKFFSLGNQFISRQWTGLEIRNRKRKILNVFASRKSDKLYVLDEIEYDLPGLIFFGFPVASIDDWLIAYIDPQQVAAIIQAENIAKIKQKGLYDSRLELFLEGDIDPEDPVLLFYRLKN